MRRRFWIEAGSAGVSALALVLTVVWPDWIELVLGVDPDHHSGSAEWLVVAVCTLFTVTFSVLARFEWRRGTLALG
jgi:hypothetical protein